MSDRLLYQSEAERLVLERGLVDAEREVPFFRFLGSSGIQGILASVSFWPLLIIESVAGMSQYVLFTQELLVKQVSR